MPSISKFIERMRYWCDEGNLGYDQSERYNVVEGGETDCSWLVIFALKEADFDTGNASWTGNLAENLLARGWKKVPNDGNPQPGDILLNEAEHVAAWLGDCLAQASIDENGNISGGASGDQTGWETNTRSYYDKPWDFYLRYMGDDDMGIYDPHESVTGDGTYGSMSDRLDYVDKRVRELVEPHNSIANGKPVKGIRDQMDYVDMRVNKILQKIDVLISEVRKNANS